MIYQFIYRTEEQIHEAIKDSELEYPECMTYVDCLEYETDKESLELAIIDFLSQELGTVWDIDPEVRVGDIPNQSYIQINAIQDYDKSWTINGLHKYSNPNQ